MTDHATNQDAGGAHAPEAKSAPLGLDNAQAFLDHMIGELQAEGADAKNSVVSVLEYLSQHIRWTREQIGSLRFARPHPLATTTDQLEEVVGETARAANDIISAAEEIEELAARTSPDLGGAISAAVTRIYEASAFQDITGQRIAKVVEALQFIESRIVELLEACAPLGESAAAKPDASPEDEALLNGPQLARNANQQSEIDALFGGI